MEKDENTLDNQEEEQEVETGEEEEESSPEVDVELDTTPPNEKLTYEQKLARATTPEEKFAIADAEASKNRRLLNKKSKADAGTPPAVSKTPSNTSSQSPNVEETVLLANGMSEDLIEELKLRAPKYGGSLIKAQNDPNFIAVKERFEKDEKTRKASLPVSRGSGNAKVKKDFSSPDLTREEHMKMVKEFE